MGASYFKEYTVKQINRFRIAKESPSEMITAGRYHPALEITFCDRSGKHTHTLSAGTDDVIHVYREANLTCVLSVNNRLGYVGLEVFDGDEKAGDIFLQEGQVAEILGRDDLAPFTIIRRLLEYID